MHTVYPSPGGIWLYSRDVTVKCSKHSKGITYAMIEDNDYGDLKIMTELAALEKAVEEGENIYIDSETGHLSCTKISPDECC